MKDAWNLDLREAYRARYERAAAALAADPDNSDRRVELIQSTFPPDRTVLEHIFWLVRHSPEQAGEMGPVLGFHLNAFPEELDALCQLWREQQVRHPDSAAIVLGLACCLEMFDMAEAMRVLRVAVERWPQSHQFWLRLAGNHRLKGNPDEALECMRRAVESQEDWHLISMLSEYAFEAGAMELVESLGQQMLEGAEQKRAEYGDLVAMDIPSADWWKRARAEYPDKKAYCAAFEAWTQYAQWCHHGHIAAGLVAMRRGARATALEHLAASVGGPSNYLLQSYGPSLVLARELFAAGERDAVSGYLRACERWTEDPDLRQLRAKIDAGGTPDFDAVVTPARR